MQRPRLDTPQYVPPPPLAVPRVAFRLQPPGLALPDLAAEPGERIQRRRRQASEDDAIALDVELELETISRLDPRCLRTLAGRTICDLALTFVVAVMTGLKLPTNADQAVLAS